MTIDGVSPGYGIEQALSILGPATKKEPILDDDLTVYTYPKSLSLVVGPDDVVREIHGGSELKTNDGSLIRLKMSHDDIVEILGSPTDTRTGDYCTFEVDNFDEFVPHPLSPGPLELSYFFDPIECRISFFQGPFASHFSLRIRPDAVRG